MIHNMTSKQLATVLAALRFWQNNQDVFHGPDIITKYREHFTEVEPLGLGEIDELCEALNFAEDGTQMSDRHLLCITRLSEALVGYVASHPTDVLRMLAGSPDVDMMKADAANKAVYKALADVSIQEAQDHAQEIRNEAIQAFIDDE